jgi:hypothetical protein
MDPIQCVVVSAIGSRRTFTSFVTVNTAERISFEFGQKAVTRERPGVLKCPVPHRPHIKSLTLKN